MQAFNPETFVATLALVGVVIMIAALLSGLIERSGLPQVAILLGLGAALGPAGLGVLDVTLDSPILRTVVTLSLMLVLFTDALTIDLGEVRRNLMLTLRVLGPGTLLSAGLVASAGWALLGLSPAAALILGAALASTDPVLLRGLLRRRDVPSTTRLALRLESGLNDAVLLPIVLVAMLFLGLPTTREAIDWAQLGLQLFLLGPGAGIAVGLLSVATLDMIRRKIGVRRDYESLYALGVAFAAFAAAEAVNGSGFLAAFAAGLTITALDIELCDCFLEYGETTAELALLFTFVLFGSSLIWSGFAVLGPATLLFAAIVLLVRPVAFLLSLWRSSLDWRGQLLIAWFGPRGLSSLLLALLPVFAGLPGSEELFAICSLVVLFSVVLHGGTPLALDRTTRRTRHQAMTPSPNASEADVCTINLVPSAPAEHDGRDVGESAAAPAAHDDQRASDEQPIDPERITIDEVRRLREAGAPLVLLDVRSERSYRNSDAQAQGSTRLPPDHIVERAHELALPHPAWIIPYCT